MLGKTLLAVGMIFVAVLAFTPRGEELDSLAAAAEVSGEKSSQNPWASESANVAIYDGWGTSLQRRPDGHFYADAYVNDVSTRFMVDTGASTIALTGEDAEAIGLYWSEDDIRPVARGASGAVYGVHVTLEQVELGGFEARNLSAIIVPEGLDISLLGQSFLGTIENVHIRGDEMVLER